MPQLDGRTYLSQVTWLVVLFGVYYLLALNGILPSLARRRKVPAKKLKRSGAAESAERDSVYESYAGLISSVVGAVRSVNEAQRATIARWRNSIRYLKLTDRKGRFRRFLKGDYKQALRSVKLGVRQSEYRRDVSKAELVARDRGAPKEGISASPAVVGRYRTAREGLKYRLSSRGSVDGGVKRSSALFSTPDGVRSSRSKESRRPEVKKDNKKSKGKKSGKKKKS